MLAMKTKPKYKAAVILTIYRAAHMSARGRRSVAAWLRRQLRFFETDYKVLAPRFTARCLYPTSGSVRKARA